jgi:hypothetical protein
MGKHWKESEKFTKSNLPLTVFKWWCENIWVARGFALVTLLNLGVVFFDLTYIPLRDFWLLGKVTVGKFNVGPYNYSGLTFQVLPQKLSNVITNYDLVKGIVPYRDTKNYLEEVDKLEENIKTKGLNSPESQRILASLRERSMDMINEDPFKLANKTGTLEKIKNMMRDYVPNPRNSSKDAFNEFWTVNYLQEDPEQKLNFFNEEIRPLISTNFFRPYSETGGFVDYFGLIDFPFFVIIAVDFFARSLYISWRYTGVNLFDAMLWRWYDLIFFLPFFRWLRVIPVTIRLDQTKLISLKAIKKQASQGFVASIAGDLTEVVILRVINQVQDSIEEGEVENLISSQNNPSEYIDLNDINEIAEITKLFVNLIAYQVLPELRSEVEVLLEYLIEKAIIESPAYQNIRNLPSLSDFPKKISQTISTQLYQVLLDVIHNLLKEDPVFELYLQKIIDKFIKTITSEIGGKQTIEQIENLLSDFLEEFKINYVQKLSEEDIENILEETRALRQAR